jgi:hypothetical protein
MIDETEKDKEFWQWFNSFKAELEAMDEPTKPLPTWNELIEQIQKKIKQLDEEKRNEKHI